MKNTSLIISRNYVHINNCNSPVVMRHYPVSKISPASLNRLVFLTYLPQANTHVHFEGEPRELWTFTDWRSS